jgi:hypothetical protein
VIALSPPLVIAASPAGNDATGCSAIVVVMLTMWPEPIRSIEAAAFCDK